VVFGLFARTEPGYIESSLGEIRDLGADAVSIVIPWVTPDVRSLEIAPRADMTPGDGALREAIREAHRLGMSVFLLPLLYVDVTAPGEWRGTLSPPDWNAWFASYSRRLLPLAALAEEERVELLSVGSELCSSETRRDAWLDLIARTRKVYGGSLTYSANWDHLEPVSFLDALDFAGTNAYFKLTDDPDADEPDLKAAWDQVIPTIESWRSRSGKPLILTEVGYPSRRGSGIDPWDYGSQAPVDLAAQWRCYRAFVHAWTGNPSLSGVYFYLWWGGGGATDRGYTPRGKPAEQVLRAWFRKGATGGRPWEAR
jgi:glycosyl hydrolase family 113